MPAMSEKRRIIALSATFAGVQGLIALVTNSFRIFFGVYGPFCVTGMLAIFFDYATRAVNGEVPYRDYLVEYPLAGFVLFLVPRLFVSSFGGYRVAFGIQLLLFNAAAVYLVARHVASTEGLERVRPRLAWYTAFFASLCPLLMGPYDLAPMAVAFAAAHLWFSGRMVTGGFLAGVGFLLKIFPGAIAAPALILEAARFRETRGRGTLSFLATVAAGMAFWVWLGGRRVADSFLYHAGRGLEVESLYAGILMLYAKASGQTITWSYDHWALHLTPDWGSQLARVALPMQCLAILFVMWRYRRSGMRDGVRYAGAAILAFMIAGKVLSPQFLIWLIPFVTVLGGETGRLSRSIFLQACIVTTLIYPIIVLKYILDESTLWGVLVLNYRNALLLGLLYLLLFGKETGGESSVPEISG
jgi:Glycosyltransferase family 87